jgi:Ca2+-binding EF-hand superfamily protein
MSRTTFYLLAAVLLAMFTAACAQNSDRRSQARQGMMDKLKAADTNDDGYIDRAEADASLPRVAKGFDKLDADQDGRLSNDELREAANMARQRFRR